MAARLDIPFYVMDVRESFRESVIADFISEYRKRQNARSVRQVQPGVKFDYLAERAVAFGAEALVTGHYARGVEVDGRLSVARSSMRRRTRPISSSAWTQEQLARTAFPWASSRRSKQREYAGNWIFPPRRSPKARRFASCRRMITAFLRSENPVSTGRETSWTWRETCSAGTGA